MERLKRVHNRNTHLTTLLYKTNETEPVKKLWIIHKEV